MTKEAHPHKVSIDMVKSAPAEVDAGAEMALKVKVSCADACDLRGKSEKIISQDDAVVKEIKVATCDDTVSETDEFTVKAPLEPESYTWTAVFPIHEDGGVLHEGGSTPFSFTVKSHTTSIAVWGMPSPISFSANFRIKVGVECSSECRLADQKIEIYDHEGGKVVTETLGDVPLPETTSLYWAEVELKAPRIEGYYTWTVKLPHSDLAPPHGGTSHSFGFKTGRPPECTVSLVVTDRDKKTPIKNANVFLNTYRASTDEYGMAKVEVPRGQYRLYASKDDEYETFRTTVDVTDDVTIKAELLFVDDPYR
jgi:hypothetical protein